MEVLHVAGSYCSTIARGSFAEMHPPGRPKPIIFQGKHLHVLLKHLHLLLKNLDLYIKLTDEENLPVHRCCRSVLARCGDRLPGRPARVAGVVDLDGVEGGAVPPAGYVHQAAPAKIVIFRIFIFY